MTKPGLAQDLGAAKANEPEDKQLYEVLQEVSLAQKEGQIFASKHGYQIPGTTGVTATPEIQISKAGAAGAFDTKKAEQGKDAS